MVLPHPRSQQAPGSLLSSQVPGDPKGATYLYVQVKNTLAVQVLQSLNQLLDVDLDLQPRPGLSWEPSPMFSSTSLPVPLPPAKPPLPFSSELGMVPRGSYVNSLPDPLGPQGQRIFLQPSQGLAWPQQEALCLKPRKGQPQAR